MVLHSIITTCSLEITFGCLSSSLLVPGYWLGFVRYCTFNIPLIIFRKSVTVMVCTITDFHDQLYTKAGNDILELHSKYIGLLEQVCKSNKAIFGNMVGDRVLLSWNTANAVGNHAEQVTFR